MTKNQNITINVFNFGKSMFYMPSNNNDGNDDRDPDNDDEEEDENVERFKRVDGYDNYSVSAFGRVRNDKTNNILKPRKNSHGYHQVGLYKKGENHSVHSLVGLAL